VGGARRETGDDVLITDATRALLRDTQCALDEREGIELRGKSDAVRLWACAPRAGRFERAPRERSVSG
jgi:class 3 adenylate cyclase